RNVFQPRVQRLEGMDAVLQYLKRTGDNPALAAAASQLMRGPRSDEERFFDAVEGEWVPGEPGTRQGSTRPSAPPPADTSDVAEMRAELLVLRASHERLRERVQRLESQLTRGSVAPDVLSVAPTPSVMMPHRPSEVSHAPEPFAATLMEGKPPAPAQTRSERARTPGAMTLPDVAAIDACLQSLIGDSSGVSEKEPVDFPSAMLGPCWVSRLIDEAGVEVGAIVADQAATATLGGALMALPEHEIEAQRSHQTPSQDVIGAMSEVSNQLCETINQDAKGTHARVKPIEPLVPGLLDWTQKASNALELELADGAGRLFLFAR
ncbi:MAG TPA: hypothetical protein VHW01_14885, partial [Polyangiaceae bacterium]|nr:hypothetical protein [Polyangiaceae bacterium]